MAHLISTAIYLAIGMLVYIIFHPFAWEDPWLYIYMALWPFILLFKFLFWFLIIGSICAAIGLMYTAIKKAL